MRLNSNGTLDNTFNPGQVNNLIRDICLQPDGKILVAGLFTTFRNTTHNRIVRLNSDGTIDNTFLVGTGADGRIDEVELQNDGKIIIGGSFNKFHQADVKQIARLNTGSEPSDCSG